MTRLLYTVGPATGTGFGLAPLTWSEIRAWAEVTVTRLIPWQAEALVLMSRAYAGEFNAASRDKAGGLAPWSEEEDREERAQSDAEALKHGLRAMMKSAGRDTK